MRIVSLVPSLSEALVALGLGLRLVGVTKYCVHPAGAFDALPKLGGTKDADVERIRAMRPDLVIANREENTERVVRKLAACEIDVWVTYPRTVGEGAALLAELAELGASDDARARVVEPVREAVARAEAKRAAAASEPASPDPRPAVFCPIWRDPWMTIARDTYVHDMIELCGGRNLAADGLADTPSTPPAPGVAAAARAKRRYPIVALEAVLAAGPDVILLPDEPYAFDAGDRAALLRRDCPAARAGRIHLIDGTLVSWYGPRIAEAIRVLGEIFANP